MKKNPGPKTSWQEAKTILGCGRRQNLPDCTVNSDPNETADHQKRFFIEKILQLVKSIPSSEGNEYLKCNICDAKFATEVDLKYHVGAFHDGKKH